MGYAEKQIGHMTINKFMKIYTAYKNVFDLELSMKEKGVRYSDLLNEASIDDAIPI